MEIFVSRGYFSDEIKLYSDYYQLSKDKYQKIFMERIQNKRRFSLMVTSLSIEGTKEYSKDYSFLDNNSILEIVNFGVVGHFTDSGKIYKEASKKFKYSNFNTEKK
mgnify:CR=1 FL=1